MYRYLAICLLLTSFSAFAALHKWVDAEGVVHYSDTVPSEIKSKTLRSPSATPDVDSATTSSSAVTAPKTLAEKEAEAKRAQKAKNEAAEKSAREQEFANNKKKNCENARTTLSGLENSPRLVTYDAKGERTFMDDNQRQQQIDEARKAISTNCN